MGWQNWWLAPMQYIAANFIKLAARKSGYTISRFRTVDFCEGGLCNHFCAESTKFCEGGLCNNFLNISFFIPSSTEWRIEV